MAKISYFIPIIIVYIGHSKEQNGITWMVYVREGVKAVFLEYIFQNVKKAGKQSNPDW